MKKLTLTFCTLFAVFVVAPALFADGPEKYSGKDKEVLQPAPPVCEWYRAHEWDLDIWGAFAFSGNSGRNDVANDDPFSPDSDPFTFDIGTDVTQELQSQNPRERINLGQVSKDQFLARDNTWGGGVDVKYFWSKYFGAGIEGFGLAAKSNFGGGEAATITVRYPLGRFAPYGWGGIGAIEGGGTLYHFFNEKQLFSGGVAVPGTEHEFWTDDLVKNNKVRPLGQLGIGLEFRVTCHIGLMADFSWNFIFGREGSADKLKPVIQQGSDVITFFGAPVSSTVVTNKALNLSPGTGSDNQDFGMARFGVTFSY